MKKLPVVAVGSTPYIAHEVATLCRALGNDLIDLDACGIANIHTHIMPNALYVCAPTQYHVLAQHVSPDDIVVLDLHPTTRFFLDMAQVPNTHSIVLFNNFKLYLDILEKECATVGLGHYQFIKVAYEEMPVEVVKQHLQHAKYIAGVDGFVGEHILQARYGSYLRDDVTIIPGKRTASVQSAYKLLFRIMDYYKNIWIPMSELSAVVKDMQYVVQGISKGMVSAVLNRVNVDNASEAMSPTTMKGISLEEVVTAFHALYEKLGKLKEDLL